MWVSGTISNRFDLTPHDELAAPFFRRLGLALRYMVWIYLNIIESEKIFWNKKSREESKAAFIWKEKRGTEHIVNKAKGRWLQKR